MAEPANELLTNPNIRRALDMIAYSEGTANSGDNGYNIGFGGGAFDSYADHPRRSRQFRQRDGATNRTTAAGRYQFLQGTWDDVAKKLNLPDFSPTSQDLAAIELIRRRGALQNVLDGDFEGAIAKLGNEWASLPSAPDSYQQPRRSLQDVLTMGGGAAQQSSPAPIFPTTQQGTPTIMVQRDGQPMFAIPENEEEAAMMTTFHERGYSDPVQARLTAALARINEADDALYSEEGLFDTMPTELDTRLLGLIDRI